MSASGVVAMFISGLAFGTSLASWYWARRINSLTNRLSLLLASDLREGRHRGQPRMAQSAGGEAD